MDTMLKKIKTSSFKDNATTSKVILEQLYPWLLFLAIFWLAWELSRMIWLAVAPPKAPELLPVPLQPPMVQQVTTANALDFFAQPLPTQIDTAPPPDIKILGVTVASNQRQSYAILNANGKTQSYRINDMIEGTQYRLAQVQAHYIMIADATGQTSKIEFGKPFSLDQSDAIRAKEQANNPTAFANPNNTQMLSPENSGVPTAPISSDPEDRVNPNDSSNNANNNSKSGATNAKSAIGSAINGLQQNAAGYLSEIGVAATGQGYLVTDSMSAGLKNRLGLQTGDKIVSVNGQNVGQNPNQDAKLLQQVQQSGQAQIQVQRGDQVVTVKQSF